MGNVGTVCQCTQRNTAETAFEEYVALSRIGYGRFAFEPVTLFEGDEILREWSPSWSTRLTFELAFSLTSGDEPQAIEPAVIDEIAAKLQENLKEFLRTADRVQELTDAPLVLTPRPHSVRLSQSSQTLE